MRIAIFGTGKVFFYFWKYIDKAQIVCLIDNSKKKIGTYIDGIQVISPEQLNVSDCDMVLILSLYHEEMKRQLIEIGIPADMIFDYRYIGNATRQPAWIYTVNKIISFEEWCEVHQNKRALLISHEMSRTGAPIALMNMARVMQRMGISVLYAGLDEGTLKDELEINQIDYIPNWRFADRDTHKKFIEGCDLTVLCTASLAWLVKEYKDVKKPILWWIHESKLAYRNIEDFEFNDNLTVFCVGELARKIFCNHFKGRNAQILQYCIPNEEMLTNNQELLKRDKITFGLIGSVRKRKALDILLRTVLKLPSDYQERIEIIIIGAVTETERAYWDEQKPLLARLKNLNFIGEISQQEVAEKYKEIDVLVCPSREDPMPIVVTQAMMYGKTCIVSKNVGQVEFIESGVNGFIFENENEFAEQIKWVIDHRERLYDIGKRGRRIYEQNFTEAIMEKKLEDLWTDIVK